MLRGASKSEWSKALQMRNILDKHITGCKCSFNWGPVPKVERSNVMQLCNALNKYIAEAID